MVPFRSPLRFAIERFEVKRLVEDAVVEKRVVVVAFASVVVPETKRPPESTEVSVDEVAKNDCAAATPWTFNFSLGVVLPMPTLPVA